VFVDSTCKQADQLYYIQVLFFSVFITNVVPYLPPLSRRRLFDTMHNFLSQKQITSFLLSCLLTFLSYQTQSQVSGLNDPTFNPGDFGLGNGDGANGLVWSSDIQSDGNILIGGEFTRYNGTLINRLARLHPDGSLDPSFNIGSGLNSGVRKLAIQNDGKIVVCGSFTSYNGITANRILRLNADGSIDAGFNTGTGFNNAIYALAIQSDGKIIVGGLFTQYNGVFVDRIVRLNSDGSIDASYLCTGANNQVSSLVLQADGKLVVGGAFSIFNGTTSYNLTRLNANGSTDATFTPGYATNGVIRSLAMQTDGKILIGGVFTTYNGTSVNRMARIHPDGTLDASFATGSGPNNTVIWSLAVQSDGKIIAGGDFTSYNGTAASRIIRLNTNGSNDVGFSTGSGASGFVLTISIQTNGMIIAGGDIATYDGINCNYITRINSNGNIDPGFNAGTGANNSIHALALQSDGKILVGGAYTKYNGNLSNRITRINSNGSADLSFVTGSGTNDTVLALAIQADGKVLAAGGFTSYNGGIAHRVIRLNSNGIADASFLTGTGFNGSVYALALQPDGKIVLGGNFTDYNGNTANGVVRLNTDGSLDASFVSGSGTNGAVHAIAIQNDGKIIIAGNFTSYNGSAAGRIVRLSTNGTADASFGVGTGADATIRSLVIQPNGMIVAGGDFQNFNSNAASRVVRLNTNGSKDLLFNPGIGTDAAVMSLSLQADGKLILGGSFSSYDGVASKRLVRLMADGTRDISFNIGAGADGIPYLNNGNVYSTAIQPDKKILIAGGFFSYQGTGRNRIARVAVCDGADAIIGPAIVCSGSTAIYSVTPIAGASSYNWMLPAGWTGASTTNSIAVTLNSSASVSLSVNAACGLSTVASLAVSAASLPLITVADATLCAGQTHTLTPTGAVSYTFSGGSNVVSPASSTSYTITGTAANSCENATVSYITVNTPPSISASSGTICTGSSYTIVPSGASTYSYSSGSAVVNPTSFSTYTVTGTDANGCINSTSLSVAVNALPNIQANTSTSPLCVGNSATLTATGGISYVWYQGSLIGSGTTLTISPNASTSYTVVGTDANGCANQAYLTQSVSALPNVQASVSQNALCAGESTTLTASGGLTYNWLPNGPVGTLNSVLVTTPTTTTTYTIEGFNANGCYHTAFLTVTVNPLPLIHVSPSSPSLCAGSNVNLMASGGIIYDWLPNGPMASSGQETMSPLASTIYTVEGTDANGCKGSTMISITVHSLPTISASAQQTLICMGDQTVLGASGAVTYNWFPDGPLGTSSETITVSPIATTSYTVEGIDGNGCSNIAIITQSVSLCTGYNSLHATDNFLVSLSPNPAKTEVFVKNTTGDALKISITDMFGREVLSTLITESNQPIMIGQLANGIYTIRAEQKNRTQTIRMIKQDE